MNKLRIEEFIEELNLVLFPNYESIKDIFNVEYGYPELDPVRDEICKCIICNLHQAAVTLTNHLVESSIKKCLALKHSIDDKLDEMKLEDAFKSGIEKYDKLELEDTINRARTHGLITKEQKKQLKKFKDEFRNPYSHATTAEIFKDTAIKGKSISLIEGENPEDLLARIFNDSSENLLQVKDILHIQGMVQVMIAKQISIPYFREVDSIIRDMLSKIKAEPLTNAIANAVLLVR
jgi:hypothetical protein